MKRINCSRDKSFGQMLSEGTQAFFRAARRVLRRVLCFAPAARAREEELEKEIKDLKTKMKVKLEENFYLSSDLQLQPLENMIVENDWKVKCEALQDQLMETEEKLSDEQEEVKYLTQQNIELQSHGQMLSEHEFFHQDLPRDHENSERENRELAAENAALSGVNSALERQLDALKAVLSQDNAAARADLEKQKTAMTKLKNCITSQLFQARDDLVNMEKSVNTARAREEELEKELEDLKMMMKVKEEENFSLSANLQLQHLENVIVENDWKVKCEALQDQLMESEEKLRCSLLEQEASFQPREDLMNQIMETQETFSAEQEEVKYLTQQNIELHSLGRRQSGNDQALSRTLCLALEESQREKEHQAAENNALEVQIISPASQMSQARDDLVNMVKYVDTAWARVEELEKEIENLRSTVKVKEEENFSLIIETEEKLNCSVLEQEASVQQREDLINQVRETQEKLSATLKDAERKEREMEGEVKLLILQNIKLQELTLKTNEYKEKVKKEEKDMKEKKQEKEREELKYKERRRREKGQREGRCSPVFS